MAAKLTEITTQYHTFVDNQVLTKDQLNEFICYFEDQSRVTRIFLTGVGIVCGFALKYNSSKSSVTITQGTAITTDGDLLKLQKSINGSGQKSFDLAETEYLWFKKFEDNSAHYNFFKRFQTVDGKVKELPLELVEILPFKSENAASLSTLSNIEDKVVLLYLESYAKDEDLCTAIDCDNQGIEQVAKLRVLLVSKNDAGYIQSLDSVYSKHNIIDSYFNLPEIAVGRVVLNQLNTANYNELKKAYFDVLNVNLINDLITGIAKIVKDFDPVLNLNISGLSLNSYLLKLKSIFTFSAYNVPFDIQYRYDFIKDITDTYNEIKSLLLSIKEECLPDINAFPKHILLGSMDEIDEKVKHFRHDFYSSPALNGGLSKTEQCRSLVFRLFQMVERFKTISGETKITPSNKLTELSFRSIPFYYDVQKELLVNWNFYKSKRYKSDTNLSYHTNLLSPTSHIQKPLLFNTDNYDFYRIEGHQGKDYVQVLDEINTIKTQNGLAFDVKALSVNANTENLKIDDYECEFEDLNVLLRAWTTEQDCVLAQVSQFFSGFSTAQPGVNVRDVKSALSNVSGVRLIIESSASRTSAFNVTDSVKNIQYKTTSSYYQPTTYLKSNTVISDNLTTTEDALGVVMKSALEETKGGSVNDIIAKASTLVAEKVNSDIWKQQPEVKEFVIDRSIELMAYSHVLSQKMPVKLIDVNLVSIDTYKLTLKELCAKVDVLKTRYQAVELSATLKALMGVLITQLSSICCSAKKLEVLLDEINKRKENLIVRLKLSNFVDLYPGLEHKAGVEPGGTFILVYLNKEQPTREENALTANLGVLKENSLLKSRTLISSSTPEITEKVSDRENTSALSASDFKTGILADTDIFTRRARITELPNNTVIADFSLPYMCCSDCAPVNFVVQKPPVLLRLEQDYYCLGKDKSPLLFEVSPADGIIKASQDVEGMTIEGNKLLFDPELFADDMIGKTIHFTVNDQITQSTITVYKSIVFDFKVPESPTSETEITFVPNGDIEGASFLWSFGDDSMSEARNPTHKYTLPVNEDNKVIVSLTVTAANGICHNTVEHKIVFAVEPTKIFIDGSDFCSNDSNHHSFGITPPGAVAKIEGRGIQQDPSGAFVFIPSLAGKGEIEFTLNGESSGLKVTVHEAPVASFVPKQNGNQLILTNNSTGAVSFIWSVNGEKIEMSDTSPLTIELTPNSPTSWKLLLTAVGEFCGLATSELTFTTRFIENTVDNCPEETKATVLTDLKTLEKLNIATSNIVNPIWTQTVNLYGGTTEFSSGILNDIDNFISGKNNGKLQVLFEKLLNATAKQLSAINPLENKEEFSRLSEIFRLQLQLFYNVLGCQGAEIIKASTTQIQPLFDLIFRLIQLLRERAVKLSDLFREYLKAYLEKIGDIQILAEHIKIVIENLV